MDTRQHFHFEQSNQPIHNTTCMHHGIGVDCDGIGYGEEEINNKVP